MSIMTEQQETGLNLFKLWINRNSFKLIETDFLNYLESLYPLPKVVFEGQIKTVFFGQNRLNKTLTGPRLVQDQERPKNQSFSVN